MTADPLIDIKGGLQMMKSKLADVYRGYIACLNARDWEKLGTYVCNDVVHNGLTVGLDGYRQARESEFRQIPDLRFDVQILLADGTMVASRLNFDITPQGEFLGLPVNGRRISFSENVFYEFNNGKIARVWSVIDKVAVETQLSQP
jgi:predicted ester cyclase